MWGGGDKDTGVTPGGGGVHLTPEEFKDRHAPNGPSGPPTPGPGYFDPEPGRMQAGYGRAADLSAMGDHAVSQERLGAGFLDRGNQLDAQAAGLRGAAAGNYGQQLDARQQSIEGLERMKQFYQQGPTPSVAQAQMGAAADAGMGARMAAGGRVGQAMNPGLGQFAGARAGEESAWRGQQMQGLGAQGQGYGTMRAGDVNALNQNLGAANGYNQLGLGYAGAGAGAIDQGMQTGLNYHKLGEATAEDAEAQRQNIILQNLQNTTAAHNAQMAAQLEQNKQDAAEKAAIVGGIGTAVGAVGGTLIGGPAGGAVGASLGGSAGRAASDVRGKKNIVPMPSNYGVY